MAPALTPGPAASDNQPQPAPAGVAAAMPLPVGGAPVDPADGDTPTSPAIRAEIERLGRVALGAAAAKDFSTAVTLLRRAVSLAPNSVAAHYNLGVALVQTGRPSEAEVHFRQAVALDPACLPAWMQLAESLADGSRFAEALSCYDKVIALEPTHVAALNNSGLALRRTGAFAAAKARFAQALAAAPADPRTRFNHAIIEDTQTSRRTALETCRQCVEQAPRSTGLLNNLAICNGLVGRVDEALAAFERAIAVDPNYHEAWFNRALLRLSLGDFDSGWREYEHRWQLPQAERPGIEAPLWNGEALDDRTILLYAEQGFGDAIQFLRYVPGVAARGGRILLRLHRPLVRLAASLPGEMTIVAAGQRLPNFDVWCPLLSLPRVLGTRLETIPAQVPYLGVRPGLAERWRRRLAALPGRRVGIAWAGDPRHANDFRRSIPCGMFEPLLPVPGISWVSLQVGPRADDLAELAARPPSLLDAAPDLVDFAETAGVIANLDLVIAADTAVVHLAGALAKPVWTLLPYSPDWRWLLDREDSPWYPTMRLFRQRTPGDWQGLVARVAQRLRKFSAG